MTAAVHAHLAASWQAQVLAAPPLIAPARHFVYPQRVAGEEDALARGALLVRVRPQHGGEYLLTCALGYRDPSASTGVFATPDPNTMLAVAGGYAYLADTRVPEHCTFLALRPVLRVLADPGACMLLLAGSHAVLAIGNEGVAWQSARLSDEGIDDLHVADGVLRGFGWNMRTDRRVPFALRLRDGQAASSTSSASATE